MSFQDPRISNPQTIIQLYALLNIIPAATSTKQLLRGLSSHSSAPRDHDGSTRSVSVEVLQRPETLRPVQGPCPTAGLGARPAGVEASEDHPTTSSCLGGPLSDRKPQGKARGFGASLVKPARTS